MDADVNSGVTIVLPHRERFAPAEAGAVAMVVHGLATGGSGFAAHVIGPPVAAPFSGVAFLPAPAPRWLPLSGSQQYIVAVARLLARRPAGLIEVHNKPEIALWLSRLFPRRPVLLVLHNDPRTMRGADSPARRQRLLARLARVVTVSETVRGWFLEGVEAAGLRPDVLHNALDFSALPPPLPAGDRDPLVLFAGRVVPDKAPDVFIAACAIALPQLPGWRAKLIGTDGFSATVPDSGFIRRLRPLAAAAGVTMAGYRPRAEVLAALSRAAVAVVPSRWEEPFGLAALEAMGCGAALVCSMRGGLAEVAGSAALAVDPDDVAGVAAALVRLGRDPALRARLAAAGRQRAMDEFALPTAIRRLDAIRAAVLVAAGRNGKGKRKEEVLF